jgi:hypothetical protein
MECHFFNYYLAVIFSKMSEIILSLPRKQVTMIIAHEKI